MEPMGSFMASNRAVRPGSASFGSFGLQGLGSLHCSSFFGFNQFLYVGSYKVTSIMSKGTTMESIGPKP